VEKEVEVSSGEGGGLNIKFVVIKRVKNGRWVPKLNKYNLEIMKRMEGRLLGKIPGGIAKCTSSQKQVT